jgi:hypothetical protein
MGALTISRSCENLLNLTAACLEPPSSMEAKLVTAVAAAAAAAMPSLPAVQSPSFASSALSPLRDSSTVSPSTMDKERLGSQSDAAAPMSASPAYVKMPDNADHHEALSTPKAARLFPSDILTTDVIPSTAHTPAPSSQPSASDSACTPMGDEHKISPDITCPATPRKQHRRDDCTADYRPSKKSLRRLFAPLSFASSSQPQTTC